MPLGQAPTVTVDLEAGEYSWFAEMEDNSGGFSGMIIRGVATSNQPSVVSLVPDTVNGTSAAAAGATVDAAASTIPLPVSGSARCFRVQGGTRITGTTVSNGKVQIK